jgi:predicted DNA-binding transcriptional regulator AlpA
MQTEFMLLAIYNKPRLSLDETCQALGMSTATGYTHRSLGKFPVNMSGSPLSADVRDVAAALDELREQAKRRPTQQ